MSFVFYILAVITVAGGLAAMLLRDLVQPGDGVSDSASRQSALAASRHCK